jgi:hypothetical protein
MVVSVHLKKVSYGGGSGGIERVERSYWGKVTDGVGEEGGSFTRTGPQIFHREIGGEGRAFK